MAKAAGVTLAGLLLLLAVALGWSLYPEQPNLTSNAGYEERGPDYRAGGPDCQPQEIDRLPSGKRSRRAVTCREAEEQYRLEANDLIQQRRSADAADATAVLTYQQTGIASLGLTLGFITMAAAIAAAFYARDAAKHTKTANDITREMSRPWLTLEACPDFPFWFDGDDARTTIQLRMENIGASVARDVIASAEMYVGGGVDERDAVVSRLREWVVEKRKSDRFHRRVILPRQRITFEPNVRCAAVDADLYRIVAYVEYRFDDEGPLHFTWEMFEVSKDRENRLLIKRHEGRLEKTQFAITRMGIGDAT